MDEKELKTSPKQRILIIVIAVVMLGSIIASYAAIVMNGNKSSSASETSNIDEAKVVEYEEAYHKKVDEFSQTTKSDYEKFMEYKGEIKAYNEAAANSSGVVTKDLKEGSGVEVDAESGSNYLAYYVGWCADESVFDSSFDDNENPTVFAKVLDPALGMIEGWKSGVEGMKIGGVREVTVPSELAYADKMEICGGYNKPLKFLIMVVAKEDPLKSMADELDEAYMRYQYAMYGIDYDTVTVGD